MHRKGHRKILYALNRLSINTIFLRKTSSHFVPSQDYYETTSWFELAYKWLTYLRCDFCIWWCDPHFFPVNPLFKFRIIAREFENFALTTIPHTSSITGQPAVGLMGLFDRFRYRIVGLLLEILRPQSELLV